VVLGAGFGTLLLLLAAALYSNPPLVPHVIVLLLLAAGLLLSINWLIGNLGLTSPQTQEAQLFGGSGGDGGASGGRAEAASTLQRTAESGGVNATSAGSETGGRNKDE
jgi:hypothetical protein